MLYMLTGVDSCKNCDDRNENTEDPEPLHFHVPEEDFEIGELLGRWESSPAPKRRKHKRKGKADDGHLLFADLDDAKILRRFLASPFTVQLQSEASMLAGERGDASVYSPVDEGGPRRTFLDKVWKQLPDLKVSIFVEDKEKRNSEKIITVALFMDRMPVKDDDLNYDIAMKLYDIKAGPKAAEQVYEALGNSDVEQVRYRLRRYYRAIGRIFFLALAAKERIAVTCLPSIVRNGTFELLVHKLSWLVRCVLSRIDWNRTEQNNDKPRLLTIRCASTIPSFVPKHSPRRRGIPHHRALPPWKRSWVNRTYRTLREQQRQDQRQHQLQRQHQQQRQRQHQRRREGKHRRGQQRQRHREGQQR